MAIGFSKWRFSSTKRLSPGPYASVWSCSGHSPPLSHTGQSSGWLASRNSSTPSWAFFTRSLVVSTTMPSVTSTKQAGVKRGAAWALDVDEAHAAHADRRHARVVAEARDVGPRPLGRRDQQLALEGGDLPAVQGEGDPLIGMHVGVELPGRVSQRGTPLLSRAPGTRRGTCGCPRRWTTGWTAPARRWWSAGEARPRRARCCRTGP